MAALKSHTPRISTIENIEATTQQCTMKLPAGHATSQRAPIDLSENCHKRAQMAHRINNLDRTQMWE